MRLLLAIVTLITLVLPHQAEARTGPQDTIEVVYDLAEFVATDAEAVGDARLSRLGHPEPGASAVDVFLSADLASAGHMRSVLRTAAASADAERRFDCRIDGQEFRITATPKAHGAIREKLDTIRTAQGPSIDVDLVRVPRAGLEPSGARVLSAEDARTLLERADAETIAMDTTDVRGRALLANTHTEMFEFERCDPAALEIEFGARIQVVARQRPGSDSVHLRFSGVERTRRAPRRLQLPASVGERTLVLPVVEAQAFDGAVHLEPGGALLLPRTFAEGGDWALRVRPHGPPGPARGEPSPELGPSDGAFRLPNEGAPRSRWLERIDFAGVDADAPAYSLDVAWAVLPRERFEALGGAELSLDAFVEAEARRVSTVTTELSTASMLVGTERMIARTVLADEDPSSPNVEVEPLSDGLALSWMPLRTTAEGLEILVDAEWRDGGASLRTVAGAAPLGTDALPEGLASGVPFVRAIRAPLEVTTRRNAAIRAALTVPLNEWTTLSVDALDGGSEVMVVAVRAKRASEPTPSPGEIVETETVRWFDARAAARLVAPKVATGVSRFAAMSLTASEWTNDLIDFAGGMSHEVDRHGGRFAFEGSADELGFAADVVDAFDEFARREVVVKVWAAASGTVDVGIVDPETLAELKRAKSLSLRAAQPVRAGLSTAILEPTVSEFIGESGGTPGALEVSAHRAATGLALTCRVDQTLGREDWAVRVSGTDARADAQPRTVAIPGLGPPLELPNIETSRLMGSACIPNGGAMVTVAADRALLIEVVGDLPIGSKPFWIELGDLAAPTHRGAPRRPTTLHRFGWESNFELVDWNEPTHLVDSPLIMAGWNRPKTFEDRILAPRSFEYFELTRESIRQLVDALNTHTHVVEFVGVVTRVNDASTPSELAASADAERGAFTVIEDDSGELSVGVEQGVFPGATLLDQHRNVVTAATSLFAGWNVWYRPTGHANGRAQGRFEVWRAEPAGPLREVRVIDVGYVPAPEDEKSLPDEDTEAVLRPALVPAMPAELASLRVAQGGATVDAREGEWIEIARERLGDTDRMWVALARIAVR